MVQVENGATYNVLLSPIMQGLIDDAKTALNLTEGNYAMFPVDVPNDIHHSIIVANAEQTSPSSASASSKVSERVMGVCFAIPNLEGHDDFDSLSPLTLARAYMRQYENVIVDKDVPHKITILEQPEHGTLASIKDGRNYIYQPDERYFGKDSVTILVEVNGEQIKVVYFIQVLEASVLGNTTRMDACSDYGTNQWKISSLPTGTDSTTITYSNLINSAVDAFKGFTDLPAGEAGIATGSAVELSFDLIGFGAQDSAVVVSNVESSRQ